MPSAAGGGEPTRSVLSVNVGTARPSPTGRGPRTGIFKAPVESIEVRDPGPKRVLDHAAVSGVADDHVGDGRHHGGSLQAVYAVASKELAWWSAELGRELRPGAFGENLTLAGFDVDAALVGERWRIGDEVEVRVTGPRIPCNTFRAAMGVPGWVRRFSDRGRTGAYLAVVTPGTIRPGMSVTVSARPDHGVTVPLLYRAITTEPDLAGRVLTAADHLDAETIDVLRRRAPYALDAEPS